MSESIKIAMKLLKATHASSNSEENAASAIMPAKCKAEEIVPGFDLASLAKCMTRLDDKDFTPMG